MMKKTQLHMSHKIIAIKKTQSKNTKKSLQIDYEALSGEGFQIIRQYGTDLAALEQDLDRVSNGQLFLSNRVGSLCHRFKVLPFSENLSEQVGCGGFHTDFMFQPSPPAFIALLCLQTDPRHPFYGRNQVVHLPRFLERFKSIFGVTQAELECLILDYDFPQFGRIRQPLLDTKEGRTIFRFHESLMVNSDLIQDIPLQSALHAVCLDAANDICLDRGDLLIISNHQALHRRSECTISFNGDAKNFESREMASIRFNL